MVKVKIFSGSHILILVLVPTILTSFSMFTDNAFAMGQNGCINEYDGPFVSFIINNGSKTFDALANPGVTFNSNGSFNATFVIHTPSINSYNNTNTGSAWYDEDVYGYENGHCVGSVGPNQNVTVSQTISNQHPYGGYAQSIIFGTHASSDATFNVQWTSPPSIPQNLQATAGNAQAGLSWTAPVDNGGYPITNYKIYRSTSSGTETLLTEIGNLTSYNDTTVANGQEYFYKVTAVNYAGESPQSNEASVTPAAAVTAPQPPTGLAANTVSSSQINLSWTAPANNGGSTITGYMIERSNNTGSTWSTVQPNTGSTVTIYNDTGLAPSTTYTYRVSAINSAGTSSPSNTASATTSTATAPPPTGITLNGIQKTSGTVSSSPYQLTLSNFNAGSGNNNLLVVGVSANNNVVASVTFGGVHLSKKVSSFSNNDAEFWYLKNPAGTGNIVVTMAGSTSAVVGAYSFSDVDQTTPIPTSITKYNTASSSPKISITTQYPNSWVLDVPSIYGGVTLGSPTCTQQWDTNIAGEITGASSSTVVQSPGSATCSWTASGGGDMWDDVAVEIKASATGSGSTTTVPSSPTGLVATAGASQVSLSWSAPSSNGGSTITNYKIYRGTTSGGESSTPVASGIASTSYTDTTATNGQAYYYYVTAVNSVGASSPSNEANATPTAPASGGSGTTDPIVLNNVQSTSGTTSPSNQITLANFNAGTGTNQLLVVGVTANNNNVASITFGGIQLTKKVSSFSNNDAEFWYLTNPSSTGNIVVTMTGSTQAVVGAYSFSGVNQTSPLPTSAINHNTSASSPSISITMKYPNDMALDLPSIYGGVTLGSPTCTQQWDTNIAGAITGASSSTVIQSPGAVTCKWTASSGDLWDDVAVELRAN